MITFITDFGKVRAFVWKYMCVECVEVADLRQHSVLPPPGHADGEQVVNGGGVLHTCLPSLKLVWKTTDDRITTGLSTQRRSTCRWG